MKVYDYLNNEFEIEEIAARIECNLGNKESLTDSRLIGCRKIEASFFSESNGFEIVVTSTGKYSLVSYGELSVGVVFRPSTGTVVYQYCSLPDQFNIISITGYK